MEEIMNITADEIYSIQKVVNELPEFHKQEGVDLVFTNHKISDYKIRIALLRFAMNVIEVFDEIIDDTNDKEYYEYYSKELIEQSS
jgi:hypothetical protein